MLAVPRKVDGADSARVMPDKNRPGSEFRNIPYVNWWIFPDLSGRNHFATWVDSKTENIVSMSLVKPLFALIFALFQLSRLCFIIATESRVGSAQYDTDSSNLPHHDTRLVYNRVWPELHLNPRVIHDDGMIQKTHMVNELPSRSEKDVITAVVTAITMCTMQLKLLIRPRITLYCLARACCETF